MTSGAIRPWPMLVARPGRLAPHIWAPVCGPLPDSPAHRLALRLGAPREAVAASVVFERVRNRWELRVGEVRYPNGVRYIALRWTSPRAWACGETIALWRAFAGARRGRKPRRARVVRADTREG